jgi:uncharacterized protein (UPF0548 family)
VFFLRRPSEARVRRELGLAAARSWSYPELGATLTGAPPAYPINHHRTALGRGEPLFRRAQEALERWEMYSLPWTELVPAAPEPRAGAVFGVLVRHFGFWSLNPCRVAYRLNGDGEVCRRGFAIGTLAGHSESGEERFSVEWDRHTDEVVFEIYTFARPQHALVKLAPPLLLTVQERFGREASDAVRRAVAGDH